MNQGEGERNITAGEEQEKKGPTTKSIIAVMSGKGGVGKSTLSAFMALTMSKEGKKVGLMDADLHGPNIPMMLGAEGRFPEVGPNNTIVPIRINDNLWSISMGFLLEDRNTPVIWRGPLKMGAIRQFLQDVTWPDLDVLIIDLPPGTGDEALSVAQLINEGSHAIVVTTPQEVALLDSRKSINFAGKLNMEMLGVVENMSGLTCPHCGKEIDMFGKGGGKRAAEELGVPYLGAVPMDPSIVKGGDKGMDTSDLGEATMSSLREIVSSVLSGLRK